MRFAPITTDDTADSHAKDLRMQEALALLEGRPYTHTKLTWWQQIDRLEQLSRSPLSVYAFKLSAASIVYTSLVWADGSRNFFTTYVLPMNLPTLVISL